MGNDAAARVAGPLHVVINVDTLPAFSLRKMGGIGQERLGPVTASRLAKHPP